MKTSMLLGLLLLFVPMITVSAQESGAPVVFKGQIACSKCWAEADRKTTPYGSEHDLECAADCKAEGRPTVLAVNWNTDATLYQLEYGKLKKTKNGWLDYTAKIVEITGSVQERKGKRYLKVDQIKVVGDSPAQAADTAVAAGVQAPELILKDIVGASQGLSSYRGKIVVLNFWATWCAPCKSEMPTFVKIQNQYAAFGVQVIGASADEIGNRDAVIKFVRDKQINFPILLGATTGDMAGFGLGPALPGTVIINREGKIAAQFRGVVTEADLKKQIDALFAEPIKDTTEARPQQKSDELTAKAKSSSVPS
jgi:peroxiredoxin